MNFEFELDREYEIDLESLSGEFKIIGDDNNSIQMKNVYIEDWLIAFVEGFIKLENENLFQKIELEIDSEPYPLVFELNEKGLIVIYKNDSLKVNTYQDAKTKLINTINLFFNELSSIPNWKEDINLKPLINYIN